MKSKKEWKSLNRRGLAALLTLAMCLGTVPLTAFATEDTHEHNQNGWYCEWTEPEQELDCQHEHDEGCYVPGEPVLECTEGHHGEDCYVPGEDVLTCENEDEDHEHDEDCYASGEDVLECDEDHHTEDCYAPAEDVLDCRHEHTEDCFSAAEGFWSCTPPVEDTADEADKDIMDDDEAFEDDDKQGVIDDDEAFEDDDKQGVVDEDEAFEDDGQTAVKDEDVSNDGGQQDGIEDEGEALVPDEVQAFLDAVADIPEITPENAVEVAEYVYGEVSECYEALLGTEYEGREDVQEAVAVYAAAVEAVDAALDMEGDDFAIGTQYQPYYEAQILDVSGIPYKGAYNSQATIKTFVDEAWNFQRLPVSTYYGSNCGHVMFICAAKYYNRPSIKSYDNDNSVVQDDGYTIGTWIDKGDMPRMNGSDCLQWNFTTLKPGKTTATSNYYVRFDNYSTGSGGCPICGWSTKGFDNRGIYYNYQDYIPIEVYARYTLDYNTQGGSSVPTTTQDAMTTEATLKVTNTQPTRDGYKFLGWSEDPSAKTAKYEGGESITLKWTSGYGSKNTPVSKTLYAVWEEDNSAPKAPTYEQVGSILGTKGFVEVICNSDPVNPGYKEHYNGEARIFSTLGENEGNAVMDIGEVEKREDGYYYCTLTLHGSAYAEFYGYDSFTGVAHTLKPTAEYPADQTITLKWDPNKEITQDSLAYTRWGEANGVEKNTILATFLVACKAPETLYTVTYTDGVPGIPTVFPDEKYEELKAGTDTPHFEGEDETGANPTRTGHIFTGWELNGKLLTPAGTIHEKVAADDANDENEIIYTAQWKPKNLEDFTKELVSEAPEGLDLPGITYPNDAGKVSFGEGDSITLLYKITVKGEKGTPYVVTDEGADWAGGENLAGTIPDDGEAVIYVTRTFEKGDIDENGNLVNTAKVVPAKGEGSNTSSTETTPVEDEQEYTLTYDANGGEGAPEEVKQKTAEFTISDTKPARAGYVFAGWADKADATEAQYQPGDKITLTKDEPDKTIHAVWAKISVTKTMKKTEGSVDDDKLRNGDTVLYTIAVTNAGNTPLNTLQFFDDMDLKLTQPGKITIDGGWNVTSTYYPADDGNAKPLLHILATGNTLEVGESVVVQYEAEIDGADGTKVINTVNVYAEIGKYVSAASRKMAAFRSSDPNGSASSEGETIGSTDIPVDKGNPGDRPNPPTTGVSGVDSTDKKPGGDTEKPPVVEQKPALSVTKAADKETASVGETITYTVTVTNTGNVDLTGVTVGDTMASKVTFAGDDSFAPFDLAAGETKTITYTYEVTAEDAGTDITNDVSVTSNEVETPVTDSVTVKIEPETVTITIKYVDEDNNPIGGTYTEEAEKGEYDVSDKIKAPDGYAIISIKGDLKGTVDKDDVTITVECGVDKRGNEGGNPTDGPDGIPDVFQPIVRYIVTGGTWQENGSTVKEVVFNLVDEQGNNLAPTLGDTIPTPVVNAETNTEEGANWTGTAPTADTVVSKDGATYTYVFPALEGMHTITVNRVHNGNTIASIPVTVPNGEAYTVTDTAAPAAFDNGGNHYIRIDALPTVPAGDENVSVNVRYAIDNIGGGGNGNSSDGIPDDQQAVVYYRSSNTAYGTVRDAYQMFDLRPNVASREETLRNAASAIGRARFTNWAMGSQALGTSATLENSFTVEAGHTYTVIANFTGNTSGGSGGGGGGGGGSSSGSTSSSNNNTNNNTNNDATTDDTVTINDAEVPLADITSLNREDHFAYVSGYTDGTVRPTNNITREEVAAIFYRLLTDVSRTVYETGVNNFSDVDSSRWSNNAISTLANAGIISGYKEGTFKPGQTITRAEFAAIASRFDTVSENVTNPFTDTEGHWAEQLISNAADKGWVGGYPDSTFQPSNAITRAEAMTLINKVLNREVDKEGLLADAKQWPDNEEGKWYYYQVLEATNSHDYERRSADSYVENWTAITQK